MVSSSWDIPSWLQPVTQTFLCGSAGATLFALLGLPAPWLSGSMLGCVVALSLGVQLKVPDILRDIIMCVLGVSMGSAVTPETIGQMARWPLSLVALVVVIAIIMYGAVVVLRRFGWNSVTAFYAAAPGALSTVMILAEAAGAEMRRVVIAQSVRLFVLVALLPSLVKLVDPAIGGPPPPSPVHAALVDGPLEYAVLIAAGALGYVLFRLLRSPAPGLIGGAILSSFLHGFSVVATRPPDLILIPSFVVLGCFIALRFQGTTWQSLKDEMLASLVLMLFTGAVAIMAAVGVSYALHLPLAEVVVAYAPGGLEAMTIMSFALGLDAAYVGSHHLMRFLGIALTLPLLTRLLFRRQDTAPPPAASSED